MMKLLAGVSILAILQVVGAFVPTSQYAKPSVATGLSDRPFELVPDMPLQRLDGGNTVRTFQMPPGVERCQMFFTTEGRPLKAKVELWCGPLRTTHTMIIDSEDGIKYPYRAVLKFKKQYPPQVVKISTMGPEFPMFAGVQPCVNGRNEEVSDYTQSVWDTSPKTKVQGGSIQFKKGGAVRTWSFDSSVRSVQLVIWSAFVGRKSFNLKVEVLQGPANKPQVYQLKCGGGSQPFHTVFETPGGCTIRILNNKYVEDGLTQVVAVPYEYARGDPGEIAQMGKSDRYDLPAPTVIPKVLTPDTAWPQNVVYPAPDGNGVVPAPPPRGLPQKMRPAGTA